MRKKLTVALDADVYDGVRAVIGQWKDLRTGYAAMTADAARERDASDWAEGLIADVAGEPRRRG
jgi:hypothetical protein